jgi:poly(A) polymerase
MAQVWWRVAPGSDQAGRALLYRLGSTRFVDRVLLAWARSPATAHDAAWTGLAGLPERWIAPTFPLKAADFIKRGIKPGPALGAALHEAEESWIAADFPADQAALAAIADAAAGEVRPM